MIKQAATNNCICLDMLYFTKITFGQVWSRVSIYCSIFKALLYFIRMKQCGWKRLCSHSIRIMLCNQDCITHAGCCYWRNIRSGREEEFYSSLCPLYLHFWLNPFLKHYHTHHYHYYYYTISCETITSQEHVGHQLSTWVKQPSYHSNLKKSGNILVTLVDSNYWIEVKNARQFHKNYLKVILITLIIHFGLRVRFDPSCLYLKKISKIL